MPPQEQVLTGYSRGYLDLLMVGQMEVNDGDALDEIVNHEHDMLTACSMTWELVHHFLIGPSGSIAGQLLSWYRRHFMEGGVIDEAVERAMSHTSRLDCFESEEFWRDASLLAGFGLWRQLGEVLSSAQWGRQSLNQQPDAAVSELQTFLDHAIWPFAQDGEDDAPQDHPALIKQLRNSAKQLRDTVFANHPGKILVQVWCCDEGCFEKAGLDPFKELATGDFLMDFVLLYAWMFSSYVLQVAFQKNVFRFVIS